MASLQFRWGNDTPQVTAPPPTAATLALLVDERLVWEGVVLQPLWAWARFCAWEVVDLWECPDVVAHYLETGNAESKEAATIAAQELLIYEVMDDDAPPENAEIAMKAAFSALGLEDLAAWTAAQNAAYNALEAFASLGIHVRGGTQREAFRDRREAIEAHQAALLRSLLLRHALPKHLHPLVDEPEHEAMVCDALLQAACG